MKRSDESDSPSNGDCQMSRQLIAISALLLANWAFTMPGSAAVAIPRMLNFQGKLTDTLGSARNGDFDMTFRLYDRADGGTAAWTEAHTGADQVHVTSGLFNVLLGSIVPIAALPDSSFLETEVVGTLLVPRQRIVSSGYSFYADRANTAGQSGNADSLGHAPASSFVQNVIAVTPLSSTGDQNPTLRIDTTMSGDLVGGYPHPTVVKLQGRAVSATAPTTNQVLTWDGSAWAPATSGAGSNYWTASGSDYIYPNTPGSGNSGIRACPSGSSLYNLYAQTNAANQYGVYGLAGQDATHGVGGANSYYSVNGALGWGLVQTNPRSVACGVYGNGGSARDGIFGTSGSNNAFGIWGYNSGTTGTGIEGTGNNQSASYPAVGCGGAFTGYKIGAYGRAMDLNSGDQTAGGYFQADANTVNNYCWAAVWTTGGTGYRIVGNGQCVQGFLTRDGAKCLASMEMPEARVEDVGRGHLAAGHARIELDPIFADCITVTDRYPLDVFVQLKDECNGIYVKTDARGFDVYELHGGKSDATFSYRVIACARNHDQNATPARFAPAPGPAETKSVRR